MKARKAYISSYQKTTNKNATLRGILGLLQDLKAKKTTVQDVLKNRLLKGKDNETKNTKKDLQDKQDKSTGSIHNNKLDPIIKDVETAVTAVMKSINEGKENYPEVETEFATAAARGPKEINKVKKSEMEKVTKELEVIKQKKKRNKEKRSCIGIWDMGESKVVKSINAHANKKDPNPKINKVELCSMVSFTKTMTTPSYVAVKNVIRGSDSYEFKELVADYDDFTTLSESKRDSVIEMQRDKMESGKRYVVSIVEQPFEDNDGEKEVVDENVLGGLRSYKDYDKSKHGADNRYCLEVEGQEGKRYKGKGEFKMTTHCLIEENVSTTVEVIHERSDKLQQKKDEVKMSRSKMAMEAKKAASTRGKAASYEYYTSYEDLTFAVTGHEHTEGKNVLGCIKVFDISTGERIDSSKIYDAYHEGALRDVKVQEKYLLTVGDDGIFKVWDLENLLESKGKRSRGLMIMESDANASKADDGDNVDPFSSVAISSDLSYIAVGQDSGHISVFDVKQKFEDYKNGGKGEAEVTTAQRCLRFMSTSVKESDRKTKTSPISDIAFDHTKDNYSLFVATTEGTSCYKVQDNITNLENEKEERAKKNKGVFSGLRNNKKGEKPWEFTAEAFLQESTTSPPTTGSWHTRSTAFR